MLATVESVEKGNRVMKRLKPPSNIGKGAKERYAKAEKSPGRCFRKGTCTRNSSAKYTLDFPRAGDRFIGRKQGWSVQETVKSITEKST